MKDLCTENCKIFLRKVKEYPKKKGKKKRRDTPCGWIGSFYIVKMSLFSTEIPVKILANLFIEIDKQINPNENAKELD